jgi:RHS repeat-associated protein
VLEDLKFISDPLLFGRHVAELNASDNALVRTYVWGLDLSGTEQGAGGIGGLLWLTQHTGANVGSHCCAYDGNGNVVALVSATTGTETARYEYGPFGEPIRVTGPGAALNPFRFSTKRTDPTTDLVLYEYRAYSPTLGRWTSRDQAEESPPQTPTYPSDTLSSASQLTPAWPHKTPSRRYLPKSGKQSPAPVASSSGRSLGSSLEGRPRRAGA